MGIDSKVQINNSCAKTDFPASAPVPGPGPGPKNQKVDPREVRRIYENYLKWKRAAENLGRLGPYQLKGVSKMYKPSFGKFKKRGQYLYHLSKLSEAEAVLRRYGISPHELREIEKEAERKAASNSTKSNTEKEAEVKSSLESVIQLFILINQKKKPQSQNETNFTDTPSNKLAKMEKPPQMLSTGMNRFYS